MHAYAEASLYHEVSSGRSIHYTDHAATAVEKGAVVFIHGSGPGASGWSNFKHNVGAFQDGGYRCIVFDQWGYGKTSKPQDVDHTLDFFVDGLVSLPDSLRLDPVTLVGHSLGGAAALCLSLPHSSPADPLLFTEPGVTAFH